jgi:RNA polymerase sigma factor (sigma-70 family)
MPDAKDMDLMREYADRNCETAFAGLVHRHINLVYSVALRFTGNSPDAQDVTQAVFIILAQKAASLRQRATLTGWLYETTRFTARQLLRTRARQQAREQEAYMQSTLNDSNSENVWRQLAPLLEEAMGRLSEKERALVALRFFEDKSAAETATLLGIQEWATHKRAARAMEKLRQFFVKRGMALTTAALAGAISANSVQAAPAMLAKAVTATAIAKGATASASTLTLIKGASKLMAWTKAKTVIVVAAAVLLAVGSTTVTVKEIAAHRGEVWQRKFDLAVLDTAPRQTTILPALRSRPKDINSWDEYHGMVLGLNQGVTEIVFAAYNDVSVAPPIRPISRARMIFSVPVPEGTYDFISNVPRNQHEALQQEIKNKFGLVGRRETIETNVLVLAVQNPNAAGLKRGMSAAYHARKSNGILSLSNMPIFGLHFLLENNMLDPQNKLLGIPVVDRTGLTGCFDLKWDSKHETLEKAVLDQLGLELVPGTDRVEFLVVDKAN